MTSGAVDRSLVQNGFSQQQVAWMFTGSRPYLVRCKSFIDFSFNPIKFIQKKQSRVRIYR